MSDDCEFEMISSRSGSESDSGDSDQCDPAAAAGGENSPDAGACNSSSRDRASGPGSPTGPTAAPSGALAQSQCVHGGLMSITLQESYIAPRGGGLFLATPAAGSPALAPVRPAAAHSAPIKPDLAESDFFLSGCSSLNSSLPEAAVAPAPAPAPVAGAAGTATAHADEESENETATEPAPAPAPAPAQDASVTAAGSVSAGAGAGAGLEISFLVVPEGVPAATLRPLHQNDDDHCASPRLPLSYTAGLTKSFVDVSVDMQTAEDEDAAEAKAAAEAEAKVKADAEAKAKADAEAAAAEAAAKAKAEAEAEAKVIAEAAAQAKEAKDRADAEAEAATAAAAAAAAAAAEAKAAAEAEAEVKAKAEAEAKAAADTAAAAAEAEAKAKAAADAKAKADFEAQAKAQAQAKADAETKAKADAKATTKAATKAARQAHAAILLGIAERLTNEAAEYKSKANVDAANAVALTAQAVSAAKAGDKARAAELLQLANSFTESGNAFTTKAQTATAESAAVLGQAMTVGSDSDSDIETAVAAAAAAAAAAKAAIPVPVLREAARDDMSDYYECYDENINGNGNGKGEGRGDPSDIWTRLEPAPPKNQNFEDDSDSSGEDAAGVRNKAILEALDLITKPAAARAAAAAAAAAAPVAAASAPTNANAKAHAKATPAAATGLTSPVGPATPAQCVEVASVLSSLMQASLTAAWAVTHDGYYRLSRRRARSLLPLLLASLPAELRPRRTPPQWRCFLQRYGPLVTFDARTLAPVSALFAPPEASPAVAAAKRTALGAAVLRAVRRLAARVASAPTVSARALWDDSRPWTAALPRRCTRDDAHAARVAAAAAATGILTVTAPGSNWSRQPFCAGASAQAMASPVEHRALLRALELSPGRLKLTSAALAAALPLPSDAVAATRGRDEEVSLELHALRSLVDFVRQLQTDTIAHITRVRAAAAAAANNNNSGGGGGNARKNRDLAAALSGQDGGGETRSRSNSSSSDGFVDLMDDSEGVDEFPAPLRKLLGFLACVPSTVKTMAYPALGHVGGRAGGNGNGNGNGRAGQEHLDVLDEEDSVATFARLQPPLSTSESMLVSRMCWLALPLLHSHTVSMERRLPTLVSLVTNLSDVLAAPEAPVPANASASARARAAALAAANRQLRVLVVLYAHAYASLRRERLERAEMGEPAAEQPYLVSARAFTRYVCQAAHDAQYALSYAENRPVPPFALGRVRASGRRGVGAALVQQQQQDQQQQQQQQQQQLEKQRAERLQRLSDEAKAQKRAARQQHRQNNDERQKKQQEPKQQQLQQQQQQQQQQKQQQQKQPQWKPAPAANTAADALAAAARSIATVPAASAPNATAAAAAAPSTVGAALGPFPRGLRCLGPLPASLAPQIHRLRTARLLHALPRRRVLLSEVPAPLLMWRAPAAALDIPSQLLRTLRDELALPDLSRETVAQIALNGYQRRVAEVPHAVKLGPQGPPAMSLEKFFVSVLRDANSNGNRAQLHSQFDTAAPAVFLLLQHESPVHLTGLTAPVSAAAAAEGVHGGGASNAAAANSSSSLSSGAASQQPPVVLAWDSESPTARCPLALFQHDLARYATAGELGLGIPAEDDNDDGHNNAATGAGVGARGALVPVVALLRPPYRADSAGPRPEPGSAAAAALAAGERHSGAARCIVIVLRGAQLPAALGSGLGKDEVAPKLQKSAGDIAAVWDALPLRPASALAKSVTAAAWSSNSGNNGGNNGNNDANEEEDGASPELEQPQLATSVPARAAAESDEDDGDNGAGERALNASRGAMDSVAALSNAELWLSRQEATGLQVNRDLRRNVFANPLYFVVVSRGVKSVFKVDRWQD